MNKTKKATVNFPLEELRALKHISNYSKKSMTETLCTAINVMGFFYTATVFNKQKVFLEDQNGEVREVILKWNWEQDES